MKELAKDVKKMSRAFTTVNAQLKILKEAESNLYDSENEDEASNFQMADINFGKSDFQFAQLDEKFEPHIASLFNHTSGRNIGIKTKLDLREVTLLLPQSKMDLFCNKALLEKTAKPRKNST